MMGVLIVVITILVVTNFLRWAIDDDSRSENKPDQHWWGEQ